MRTTLVLVTLSVATTASASPFGFQVPPGWVDLSPGAPAENFRKVPAALAAQVRNGHTAFYAADVDHADDGFMENVNVALVAEARPVSMRMLDAMMAQINAEVGRQAPGMTFEMIDKKLIDVGGVTCGRTVANMSTPTLTAKQVQYYMPGATEMAILTYSTTPEKFAEYEPVFDAAARATTGLRQPRTIFQSAGRGALFGGIAGAIAVIIAGVFTSLRKKRS